MTFDRRGIDLTLTMGIWLAGIVYAIPLVRAQSPAPGLGEKRGNGKTHVGKNQPTR